MFSEMSLLLSRKCWWVLTKFWPRKWSGAEGKKARFAIQGAQCEYQANSQSISRFRPSGGQRSHALSRSRAAAVNLPQEQNCTRMQAVNCRHMQDDWHKAHLAKWFECLITFVNCLVCAIPKERCKLFDICGVIAHLRRGPRSAV